MLGISTRFGETGLLNAVKAIVCNSNVPVRYRYYNKEEHDNRVRRYGYDDKLSWRGLLPRSEEYRGGMPVEEYLPKNAWSERKALFGQNDYIDILGDEKVHPVLISYNVPAWLKGFKGSEFQMLLRKRNFFGWKIKGGNPDEYQKLRLRLKFLYRRYNYGWLKTRMHPRKDKLKWE